MPYSVGRVLGTACLDGYCLINNVLINNVFSLFIYCYSVPPLKVSDVIS